MRRPLRKLILESRDRNQRVLMAAEIKSKSLAQLVTSLRETVGDNLSSIVLYGATAIAEDADHRSDHNVLIVLRSANFVDLKTCAQALRAWHGDRQLPPVIFTVDELKSSVDVFPIEFLQMETARKVLFGSDPFASLEISSENLRHQTEYDLRTKFTQLRRLYVAQSPSGQELANLMIDSFASFAALFRAVLILRGEEPPLTKADTVRSTVKSFNLNSAPFEWILARKSSPRSAADEAERMFAAYLDEIAKVIDAVDQLNQP